MKLNLGRHPFSECWDGVYYKVLSDYPRITPHEIRDVLDFMAYEKAHGRSVEITADPPALREVLLRAAEHSEAYQDAPLPPILRECTACPERGGCMTDLVCHTAPVANAIEILKSGFLLSAVQARGVPAEELAREPRNAAKDPPDFFHYVMFAWGNCQAGDRLVMERLLRRAPTPEEMGPGFIPGVRFYCRYAHLDRHPCRVHDGILPIKVRDRVSLEENVFAILVPEMHRQAVTPYLNSALAPRAHFLESAGLDVWAWSEKAYCLAHALADEAAGAAEGRDMA